MGGVSTWVGSYHSQLLETKRFLLIRNIKTALSQLRFSVFGICEDYCYALTLSGVAWRDAQRLVTMTPAVSVLPGSKVVRHSLVSFCVRLGFYIEPFA